MTKIKSIAWDLDGTLADSEVLAMPIVVGAAADDVEKQSGILIGKEKRAELVQKLMGKTSLLIGKALGSVYGVSMLPDFQERVRRDTLKVLKTKCQPVDGALETVAVLQQQGYQQWIATGSNPVRVRVTLRKIGLIKQFPVREWDWFSAKIPKDDPEVYNRSSAVRGSEPEEEAAVEDSPTGIGAAVNAKKGLIIGFTGGSHILPENRETHGKKLLEAGAHVVVDDLRKIPAIIAEYNARQDLVVSKRPAMSTQSGLETKEPR